MTNAGATSGSNGAPTLREIFDIPDHTGTDDYVLRLASSVTADRVERTLADYVVTPDLARAFDQALALVGEAQRTGINKAAFLEGSFGSGKSHFMAVLHAILAGHPAARAKPGLQEVIGRHAGLERHNVLRLTFHFLDSETVESTLFRQYLDQVAVLHPQAPMPVLHSAAGLFDDAENLRRTLGDESFLAGLQGGTAAPSGIFARLGVAVDAWTLDRYRAAIAADAPPAERTQLTQAMMGSHFRSYRRNTDWLSVEDGLAVIAEHARSLGYDGVVLLLDELILWLTFLLTERERLNREVQKITKLVESGRGALAVPITSFVARQHDLARWLDTGGGLGAERDALERALQHQSGRFSTIKLGDENLPFIAHQRLLTPRTSAAQAQLDDAFRRLDRSPLVWDVLRNGVNLGDDQRAADAAAFRLTYPFSPALIDTLTSLAGVMQRERTALKVMQKMLADHADDLTIAHVIPVGDAFDHIISGTATASDPRVNEKFAQARDMWRNRLRPLILRRGDIDVDTNLDDADLRPSVRNEMRLAKTVVLAALAPNVPAMRGLDAARLAALNHGSIREVLPGDAGPQALRQVRNWVADGVPEVNIGTGTNPVITVTLADVDFHSVLERARNEDNDTRRRELFRDMLFEELGVDLTTPQMGGVHTRDLVWRGTRRQVDWLFGNVRDRGHLSDDAFVARPGTVRMVLDYPFDEPGFTAAADHERLGRWKADHSDTATLVWLPAYLTEAETGQLGTLVKLNAVLRGDNWQRYSSDLAPTDRQIARNILESQQDQLRRQFATWIQQVYGAATGRSFRDHEPPLVSLTEAFNPPRPVGANLREAADRVSAAVFAAMYANHPDFTPADQPITDIHLTKVLKHLRDADAHPDNRVALDRDQRDLVRRVVMPLALATVNETHLYFGANEFAVWDSRIIQALGQMSVDPSGPVEVEVLRQAINPDAAARGLMTGIVDLIAAGWALRHRRSWKRAGSAIGEPATIRDFHPDQVLMPQRLPERDQFAAAVERHRRWFVESPLSTHLTASNLATFVHDADIAVREHTRRQEELAERLAAAYTVLRLDSGTRLDLARRTAEFGAALGRSADPVRFVELLAAVDLGATDDEVSRALSAGERVAEAVGDVDWSRWEHVQEIISRGGAGADPEAERLAAAVRTALADHEFNVPLVGELQRLERRRQDWLQALRPPPVTLPVGPGTSGGTSPSGGTWRGTTPSGVRPLDITLQAGPGLHGSDLSDVAAAVHSALAPFAQYRFEISVWRTDLTDDTEGVG